MSQLDDARSALVKAAVDVTASNWMDSDVVRTLCDAARAYTAAYEAMRATRPAPTGVADTGAVFPPYGKTAGQPVAGASRRDLEFYRGGCLRTLADASKKRWWSKEEALLAAINAELSQYDDADADVDRIDTAMRWDGQ